MKIIVDEAGEIIAKSTDDHILIGGHHRLAVAASLGKRLFWRDTGEPVKLDLFFKRHGSSLYSRYASSSYGSSAVGGGPVSRLSLRK
jgi:hypothetical protein